MSFLCCWVEVFGSRGCDIHHGASDCLFWLRSMGPTETQWKGANATAQSVSLLYRQMAFFLLQAQDEVYEVGSEEQVVVLWLRNHHSEQ